MPTITIDETTFANLRMLKIWHDTVTPSETVEAVVNDAMCQLGLYTGSEVEDAAAPPSASIPGPASDPASAPPKDMKVIKATVDGEPVRDLSWIGVLRAAILALRRRGTDIEQVMQDAKIAFVRGEYTEKGYYYVPNLGVSLRNLSSRVAWTRIERLATQENVAIRLEYAPKEGDSSGDASLLTCGPQE